MRDPKTNRFRAAHDRSELMEIAEAVLRQAAADEIGCRAEEVIAEEILEVSQSAFDRSRAAAGFPLAPPARELCRRVGQPWVKVKGYVAEGRRFEGVLAQAPIRQREWRRQPEEVVPALRAVARRLGITHHHNVGGGGEEGATVGGDGDGDGDGAQRGGACVVGDAHRDDDGDDQGGVVFVVGDAHRAAAADDRPATTDDDIINNTKHPVAVSARMDKLDYASGRELMLREDRRRRHGGALALPSVTQVLEAVGDWAAALELAGLPDPEWRSGPRGLTVAEALDLCFEQHGVVPTHRELLETWRRAQGVPIVGRNHSRPWAEELAAFRARWAVRGVSVPKERPPTDQRPDFTLKCPKLPDLPANHRRKRRRSQSELVNAVIAYLEQLAPGAQASARGYRVWAEARPEQPSISTLDKRVGWSAIVAEARQRLREDQPVID